MYDKGENKLDYEEVDTSLFDNLARVVSVRTDGSVNHNQYICTRNNTRDIEKEIDKGLNSPVSHKNHDEIFNLIRKKHESS